MKPRRPIVGGPFDATPHQHTFTLEACERPHPTIWQTQRAWLLHNRKYYSVALMPSELFKRIVLESCPYASNPVLEVPSLDICARWYILTLYPVKLFYMKGGIFVD